MRSFPIVGLLVVLCASAGAQAAQRGRASTIHPHARQQPIFRPDREPTPPARFAVPGWSDRQTQQWLDNATSCEGCG